jgi:hypothetical protein
MGMSSLDFFKDLNDIDETMLREAEPGGAEASGRKISRVRIFRIAGVTAAVLLLAVGTGIWMQSRGTRIPEGAGSETVTEPAASLPESTAAPESTAVPEETQKQTESETLPPETETESGSLPSVQRLPGPRILTEEEEMARWEAQQEALARLREVVSSAANQSSGGEQTAEYCLSYLTERELFGKCDVLLRARVTEVQNLSVQNEQTGRTENFCVVTLEPGKIIRGELKKEGPVRLYLSRYTNTSLEGLSKSLNGVQTGREGILMLYEMEDYAPEYRKELADYTVGDNERFAIWETAGGLSFAADAFPSFQKDWTLDQAAERIRDLIGLNDPAPSDFAVSFRYQVWGHVPEDDTCCTYDSRTGEYSLVGSYHMEEEYGRENLTGTVYPGQVIRNELYQICRDLKDLPEVLRSDAPAGGPDTVEIEIWFRANGAERTVSFSGKSSEMREDVRLLERKRTELDRSLSAAAGLRQWWTELNRIAAERRTKKSLEIADKLLAALEEKYGPGQAPDYYLGMEITSWGYLQILIASSDNKRELSNRGIEEIISLLGFLEGYSFTLVDVPN